MTRKLLFVCLGNICRSPTAEAAMLLELERRGLTDTFVVDSAATSSAHLGELPHPETRREAARHGLTLTHRARQVVSSDFERFDLILAMDRNNERELLRLAPSPAHRHKVKMFLSFLPAEERAPEEMPDPYYTGQFPEVFSLSQRAARALLDHVTASGVP